MADRQEPVVNEAMRQQIGRNLWDRRKALGMTRKQVGARMRTHAGKPVSESQVSHWENARFVPEPFYRPQLADALETSEAALFGILASTGQDTIANKIDAVNDRIDALASILGVTEEELDRAVQRRRRVRRTTSPAKDEPDHEPSSLIGDLGESPDGGTVEPLTKEPRRGRGRATGRGRGKR